MFNDLCSLEEAAKDCAGHARRFIEYYSVFHSSDQMKGESRAEQLIEDQRRDMQEIQDAMEDFNSISTLGQCLDAIKFARGAKLEVIIIGNKTYATAHEAAYGLAEEVRSIWIAPPGWNPTENCLSLARQLRAIHCVDLFGWIEVEFFATCGQFPLPPESTGPPTRMSRDDADEKAWKLNDADAEFENKDVHSMAKAVGCSHSTLRKTRFWAWIVERQPHRQRTIGRTPKLVQPTDAILNRASDGEPDILSRLASDEAAITTKKVMACSLSDREKAEVLRKLEEGEMTDTQALGIAQMFPGK